MISTILLSTTMALGSILVSNIVMRIYKVYKSYIRFRKDTQGLPVLPFNWSPTAHIHKMVFDPMIVFKLESYHRQFGKTFGWMLADQPVVTTTDLNLIKFMNIDEADKHINRVKISLPLQELQSDTIMFSFDEQWKRIRRSIASSLT